LKDLRKADLTGKVVAVRADLNVPTDEAGKVMDGARIMAALPTLEYVAGAGAKVLVLAHFKRPRGAPDPTMSLRTLAETVAERLGRRVEFAEDCIGAPVREALERIDFGEVVLAENVRFHAGETENDPEFARELAAVADVFINDAFGAAHRAHASVVGLAKLLPAYPGFLLRNEIETLTTRLQDPKRPLVAVVGGAKISTKLGVLRNLLDKVDTLLLGGGMANTFLSAQGNDMGRSLVETNLEGEAREIMEQAKVKGVQFVLPADGVMGSDLSEHPLVEIHGAREVPHGWSMLDIGPTSVGFFSQFLDTAGTIVWNGPMGMAERPAFAEGTRGIALTVSNSPAFTIVGGGDSVAALKEVGLLDRIDHVSTGGGASLEVLEGKTLPGVAALE